MPNAKVEGKQFMTTFFARVLSFLSHYYFPSVIHPRLSCIYAKYL